MKVGGRGQFFLHYDTILALIFLAAFAFLTFYYVNAHANGDSYFSTFYAADISTSANLVNAAYGDVSLRYDNFRPNNGLSFWFTNSKVSVGATPKVIVDASSPPPGVAKGYYGIPHDFAGQKYIEKPTFLILKKIEGSFSVSQADGSLTACPAVAQKQVPFEKAGVYLQAPTDVSKSFSDSLKDTGITQVDNQGDATITILLDHMTGTRNEIVFGPSNEDGKSLDCNFVQQLAAVSVTQLSPNEPDLTSGNFQVKITITTTADSKLTEEQIGRALAHALVVYYR